MSRAELSEVRRNQIIEAAINVFTRRGFRNATMDDIVRESGLSKGALYWYFKSKDDIIVGLIDHLLSQELTQLQSLNAAKGSPRQRLQQFIDLTIQDTQDMLRLMPVYYEFFALASRRKEIQALFTRFFRAYMDLLTPIFREGMEQGDFRPMDPQDAAIALGAALEGTILLVAYDPKRVALEKHMRIGCQLILEGLLKAPGARKPTH